MSDAQRSLHRVASAEIGESQRWDIHTAWGFEYNRIKQYIEGVANHNVGARMHQEPADRASGAKLDGQTVPEDVNAIFGALPIAVDADVIGRASRGELHRTVPSPMTVRFLAIGTLATAILEVSIFLIMWLMGQGGNLITVGVGLLLAGFGYLTGEGLGRLLIANEDKEQRAGLLAWIFLLAGLVGISGMTVIRYLAARAAADEGEQVAGLIALVLLTALLAAAIAVFHAAHLERSNKRRRLVADMFSAQMFFSTQQARESYQTGLWRKLYDQAVEALVAGRPMPSMPASTQTPAAMFGGPGVPPTVSPTVPPTVPSASSGNDAPPPTMPGPKVDQ